MIEKHPFENFLEEFIPKVSKKFTQLNKVLWIAETTGSADAAELKADLDAEFRFLFSDPLMYQNLLSWEQDQALADPILKRQLNTLIRTCKQNQLPKIILEEIAQKESALSVQYVTFRPLLNGKEVTENEIRNILKNEKDVEKRKAAWEASKKIGEVLAPPILALVELRNKAAVSLGYPDYFTMQLDLQEVDADWLIQILENLAEKSKGSYHQLIEEIEKTQAKEFAVPRSELGPWSWTDPFGQEDPLNTRALDLLVEDVDIVKTSAAFYQAIGIDVDPILARSDLYERSGKNQHAFCINMNRASDIRTLNNIQNSMRWLETLLHELGHAVYEMGIDPQLPWLLRAPPHMIPTEAMALLAGRQAYRYQSLGRLVGESKEKEVLRKEAEFSLIRRQLIFSRWVLVMTMFERELYRNPTQDLNRLWWSLVKKYQNIQPPGSRDGKSDWAAKYHIGLAPVYYFSYLLGEMFASSIQEKLVLETGSELLISKKAGRFLQEKLFFPGDRMNWNALIMHVTGKPPEPDAWIREFAR